MILIQIKVSVKVFIVDCQFNATPGDKLRVMILRPNIHPILSQALPNFIVVCLRIGSTESYFIACA